MARKLYWCGDDVFRGCILRHTMPQLGLQVLIPKGVTEKGFVRKESSSFDLSRVTRYLRDRGCPHLDEIDKTYNVRGRGDIDFAAKKNELLYVAEVKTRLIISKYPRINIVREMLKYHLAAPPKALAAWKSLEKAGQVKPSYDNPASIAELTRLTTAAYTMIKPREMIIGMVTLSYAKPLLQDIISYVADTVDYLKTCNLPITSYAVIVLKPEELTDEMLPRKLYIKCYGTGCDKLSIPDEGIHLDYDWNTCPQAIGCKYCSYHRLCLEKKLLLQELPSRF